MNQEKTQAEIDSGLTAASPDKMTPASLQTDLQKWESKIVKLAELADLSEYGNSGWELVSVVAESRSTGRCIYQFRRPIK
jgi:hypothetical protein